MSLGNRNAHVHETAGYQKLAVNSADYADFREGENVMTCDGFPGVVAAVEDGPYPGTEQYLVTLHNDMGGGVYTTSQLRSLPSTASTDHAGLASESYPELGSILFDRPDIAVNASFSPRPASDDAADGLV